MLDALAERGYRLGVFTTATKRAAMLMLATTGLDAHFATVVCGDQVTEPKPSTDGLHLACCHLGVTVDEAAYVGDGEVDLQCALAAGSLAVHATWNAPDVMLAGNHAVARRPTDVVGLVTEAHANR